MTQETDPQSAKTSPSSQNLARFIDHTLLKPEATEAEIKRLCEEAQTHGFATVCVNGRFIPLAAKLLASTPTTLPIAVVGFPLGACATASKVFETKWAVEHGAKEIDMVISVGALLDEQDAEVESDIRAVVKAAGKIPVKVILETCLLNQEQKVRACQLSVRAGAAFVKTSTGFSKGGATVDDIQLMRQTVGPSVGVKASGGIRTREDALKMIEAGANRVGASASVAIVRGANVGAALGY